MTYLNNPNPNLKDRLAIERKLHKFQDSNTQDWLFNLILMVYIECQKTKEKR